ncbi:TPA: hypothetical protein DEW47_00275 [Patescibacteria group bacterium]|nr:MAG: Sugar kinase, ribokinase family [Parcubacteria group bacterium GW2011_GWF2_40_10]KKR46891.1 MAG: Sugar kinase, ribokinase family [Parcubacteria group bacterium GW2011_GWA2_40_143]KKR59654.1 MAG: Sugar kinase, ribokinase family [Parcubacteria group bacterium GW2011_GWC2_40_31]KKR75164.1 MAG: Sugar kinase, ribokinase family [Parcubacteria group bacterium GW2011_GWB2_40_8]KKR83309.1 MAG: Sugar kinase, ribokinase family [Parcubacteria group bacterium GW2011_GWD2_40_9]HCI04409.1 hypothetica
MKNNLDFVAIGDVTTDAFIKLKDAKVLESEGKDKPMLCFSFADKVPYEFVEVVPGVGNSANAAVAATRLGLDAAFVSNIGDDRNGEDVLKALKDNGISTEFVKTHKSKSTNYHYVLWYKADRTILVKHTEFDYSLPDIGSPKWIYLSSLAENSLPFHQQIAAYIKERPEIKLAFQPGTFQMSLGYDKLKGIYELSELFFCNVQEAQRILKDAGRDTSKAEIKDLLKMVQELGPKIVVITDGPDGAYAYDKDEYWYMPAYPDPKPPIDRTGAGDSFSSTFTAAIALGKSVPEALAMGPINSMSVVQEIGAQKGLLTLPKIEEYLRQAPGDYKPRRIN